MVRHSRCNPAERRAHIWRAQDVLWWGPAFHIRRWGRGHCRSSQHKRDCNGCFSESRDKLATTVKATRRPFTHGLCGTNTIQPTLASGAAWRSLKEPTEKFQKRQPRFERTAARPNFHQRSEGSGRRSQQVPGIALHALVIDRLSNTWRQVFCSGEGERGVTWKSSPFTWLILNASHI